MTAPLTARPAGGEAPGRAHPDCPSTRRHGTAVAYNNDGCRCPDARWSASKDRARRATADYPGGLLDPTGTRRRIEALMAIGWPRTAIAAAVGLGETTAIFRRRHHRRVLRSTALAVQAAYDHLSGAAGPSPVTAGRARADGMVPPIGWDDNIDDPAALPWVEQLADGTTRDTVKPCARPSCYGYIRLGGKCRTYCSDRCAVAARRAFWRDRERARRATRPVDVPCGQTSEGR